MPNEASLGRVNPLFPRNLVPIVTASQAGVPEGLFFTDLNNLVPRFGFAFRPFADAKTVLRGAYGLYIDDLTSQLWRLGTGGPYVSSESFTNTITAGVAAFQFPRAFPAGFGAIGAQNFDALDPHIRNPYIQQWNLTAEREAAGMGIRLSYIGTNSRQLSWSQNINQPPAGERPFSNALRRYPNLRDIRFRQHGALHNYHSLHVVAERKTKGALHYQLGWVWAKNLTDAQSDSEQGSQPEDAYNRTREYSNVGYTPRHRVTGTVLYALPVGRGRPWLSNLPAPAELVLGGWELSAIFVAETGQFFSPSFNGFDVSNTNVIGGRPDRVADGNLPASRRNIEGWFDVAGFRVPGDLNADGRPDVNVGRFGNSAPNVLVGPGVVDIAAGLHKQFRITEKFRAVLQGTFRNVVNHPNYGFPAANIRAANVGTIRGLNGQAGPRSGQVALRVEF